MGLTFGQFKSDARKNVFAGREPANLVDDHNKSVLDALVNLQRFVKCLQVDHVDIRPHCSTFYNCGLTVTDAPEGSILDVSVIDKTHTLQSDPVTATKDGATVTSDADFFDASMVGSIIKFADGQSFLITEFIDKRTITIDVPTPEVAASLGFEEHSSNGNPNGNVFANSPAVCFDTLNKIIWWKTDGNSSNTGWE